MVRLLILTGFVFGLCLSLLSGWHLAYKQSDEMIGWVIFTAPDKKSGLAIYRMRFDGSFRQNLTNQLGDIVPVGMTSEGKWLFFISNRTGKTDIYRTQLNSSNIENITQGTLGRIYTWASSPTAGWLIVVADRDGSWDIYRMRLDGSQIQNLTQTPDQDEYSIYPSRNQNILGIYRQSNAHYQIHLDGSISEIKLPSNMEAEIGKHPILTDNNEWVIFQGVVDDMNDYDIFRIHPGGSELENLTLNSEGSQVFPTLTQSGQWVVFLSHYYDSNTLQEKDTLYRMRPDGTELKSITTFASGEGWGQFMVSSNEKWIFFRGADSQGYFDLYRVDFDGSNVKRLTYDHIHRINSLVNLPGYPAHPELMLAVGIFLTLGNMVGLLIQNIKTNRNINRIVAH